MQEYATISQTSDTFPDDYNYLTFLKKVFRHELRKNGFRRITTPLIENKELFEMVLGDDVKDKQQSQAGIVKSNPNISIMRAYINAEKIEEIQPVYYYYMDSILKNHGDELRDTELFGGEILGESDPILDAISLYITHMSLETIGLKGTYDIRINALGIEKEKVKYREELISFYENKKHMLSEKSQAQLEKDPIKLLASEDEDEKILASQAPVMTKLLKKESKLHREKFLSYLDILEIPYTEDHTLVGDYDYNTHIAWELRTHDGRQISKGARSNDLSKKMGQTKDIPSFGFFTDTSVVINLLKENNIRIKNKDKIDLFFVQLGDEAKSVVLPLSLQARAAGINTVVSLGTPSMKEQMLKAQRSESKYVVMVGIMEARNGMFQVRDSEAGTQEEVHKDNLIEYIIEKIGADSLDFYCPANDLIEG